MRKAPTSASRALLVAHGVYYMAAGLWPILQRSSFEKVTGPKTDFWLVRTVGALITVIGATMLVAARRDSVHPETRLLAGSSAGALAAVDAGYAAAGRIPKVYLLDAALEAALAVGWLATATRRGSRRRPERLEILTGELQPD